MQPVTDIFFSTDTLTLTEHNTWSTERDFKLANNHFVTFSDLLSTNKTKNKDNLEKPTPRLIPETETKIFNERKQKEKTRFALNPPFNIKLTYC